MVTQGLLVRLEARHGAEGELESFLIGAREPVAQEPETTAWFALRFGRGEYGCFDAFPNESACSRHLAGPTASALNARSGSLLARAPQFDRMAILACKLPRDPLVAPAIHRGLLLSFKAKQGHVPQVEAFLRNAQSVVQDEPGTIAWFALKLPDGEYGIFDVFVDNGARLAHLTGQVPRELAKHAPSLLGGVPDMEIPQVLAANFSHRDSLVGLGID